MQNNEKEEKRIMSSDVSSGDVIFLQQKGNLIPYIVLKNGSKYFCLKGYRQAPNKKEGYVTIYCNVYGVNYPFVFDTTLIHKLNKGKNIISKFSLNNDEFKKIKSVAPKTFSNNPAIKIDFDINLKVGDIINDNDKKYLIIDEYDNEFSCLYINSNKKDFKLGDICLDDVINIKKQDKNEYIDSISNERLILVLKLMKKSINEKINLKGRIINYNDELYYVLKDENNVLSIINILLKVENEKFYKKIMLNNISYYTKFEIINFSKDNKYDIVNKASELEIKRVKSLRKHLSKERKKEK